MEETTRREIHFNDFVLELTSDVCEDKLLDTMIHIHPKGEPAKRTYLLTIEGGLIEAFLYDVDILLDTYTI